jgi:Tfp pilus assembly protein PilV
MSLLEVLISLVVLSVGAFSLVTMIPAGMKRIQESAVHSRASSFATRQAETLLITPYEAPALTEGTHNDTSNPYPGSYYVKWIVEDDQPHTNCKRVTVTVHRNSLSNPYIARVRIVKAQAGG